MTDCIKSLGPEYCYGRARSRADRSPDGASRERGRAVAGGARGPVGPGGVGVGPGWSSAALGGLEHAAEGSGAFPLGGPAQNQTPQRERKALHRIELTSPRRTRGSYCRDSGGLDWRTAHRTSVTGSTLSAPESTTPSGRPPTAPMTPRCCPPPARPIRAPAGTQSGATIRSMGPPLPAPPRRDVADTDPGASPLDPSRTATVRSRTAGPAERKSAYEDEYGLVDDPCAPGRGRPGRRAERRLDHVRRNDWNQRYSGLKKINTGNVSQLVPPA